ncbi:MAG: sigma factor-like helix-turn-helix DNA-binding protein, partial [Clostridia bacterium]|nr:sigma factor-like helix-turn-helix DNA-binding protein [Clostridia bacterium]
GLKKESRIYFVRRYWYADSIADIAKRYGVSESKVKSSLFRTRNALRVHLEKEGIEI